jgi:AcrR family transcriptional regulator
MPDRRPSPKRRRLSAAERRQQILDAARPLFVAGGLSGTRTRDVASAAGVNEALLYQHFSSKEELFHEAIIAPLERTVDRLAQTAPFAELEDSGRLQRAATERFVRTLLETFVESVSLFGVVLFSDRAVGARFYNEQVVPLVDRVAEAVEQNLAGWPHRDFEPRLTIVAAFGMCWSVAIDAAYREVGLDVDAASAQLTDLVFFGVQGAQVAPRAATSKPRPPRAGRRKGT